MNCVRSRSGLRCWCRGRSFVEEDAWIGFDRRIVRDTVRQEVPRPKRVQLGPKFRKIDRLLFQRLKDHLVADLADPHFLSLEAEFLGQADGLAAAMHEDLGGGCHSAPLSSCDVYQCYISPWRPRQPSPTIGQRPTGG